MDRRDALITVYRGKCQYCGRDGARDVEHIEPRAKGGDDSLNNITLACDRCNGMKAALELPETYKGILLARAADKREKIEAHIERATHKPARDGEWGEVTARDGDTVMIWLDSPPTLEQANRFNEVVENAMRRNRIFDIRMELARREAVRETQKCPL